MKFLKAITTDGNVEYFNVSKILAITPKQNGSVTVLMGAGLYWNIKPETMVFIELEYIPGEIMEV